VAIRNYPPEDEIEIYIASGGTEPPSDLEIDDSIAEKGNQIVPEAMRRLRETNSDNERAALITS